MKELFLYALVVVFICGIINNLLNDFERCEKGGYHDWKDLSPDLQTRDGGEHKLVRQECQKCKKTRDFNPSDPLNFLYRRKGKKWDE